MGLQKTYKTEGTCALNKYVCLLSLIRVAIFIYSSVKRVQEMLLSKIKLTTPVRIYMSNLDLLYRKTDNTSWSAD